MIRQTSIDCYNQIKAEGLLAKRRFEVYEAIYNKAPCTSAEAMAGQLNGHNVLSQSRARFTELRELGVIYERGERHCRITGRKAIEWDLTDRLPVKKKKIRTTRKQKKEKILNGLRKLYKNRCIATDQEWTQLADLIKQI